MVGYFLVGDPRKIYILFKKERFSFRGVRAWMSAEKSSTEVERNASVLGQRTRYDGRVGDCLQCLWVVMSEKFAKGTNQRAKCALARPRRRM